MKTGRRPRKITSKYVDYAGQDAEPTSANIKFEGADETFHWTQDSTTNTLYTEKWGDDQSNKPSSSSSLVNAGYTTKRTALSTAEAGFGSQPFSLINKKGLLGGRLASSDAITRADGKLTTTAAGPLALPDYAFGSRMIAFKNAETNGGEWFMCPDKKLIIPLHFFFTDHPSSYFPHAAMAGCHEVKVHIRFRSVASLLQCYRGGGNFASSAWGFGAASEMDPQSVFPQNIQTFKI